MSKSKKTKAFSEQKAKKFIEELSWLLDSYSDVDFKRLPELLLMNLKGINDSEISKYVSMNPNVHFLSGVLPRIFTNEDIFATNEEIVEFSDSALGVRVNRWSKISKTEIIGHIVCRVQNINDTQLEKLVLALNKLLAGDNKATELISRTKNKNRDWNLIIQELTKDG